MSGDREHRIRERAHAIWEGQGRPHGADREHWEQATKEIDAESELPVKKAARSAAKPKAPAVMPKAAKTPAVKKPAKAKAI